MTNNEVQKDLQEPQSKLDWSAPELETCNIDQTMFSTKSGSDGPSSQA